LTLYRKGFCIGLSIGLAIVLSSYLPWHLVPTMGNVVHLVTVLIGAYLAAALIASLSPHRDNADSASSRWL
jgi:hypothetical protein